jgi:phosphoesterase RecJ-like protein
MAAVALHFGGGGHVRAAGCTISGAIHEVKQKMIDAVIEALEQK